MLRLSTLALAALAATSSLAAAQTTAAPSSTPAQGTAPTTTAPAQGTAAPAQATTTTMTQPGAGTTGASTIAAATLSNPRLSTLASAVQAADLGTTLSGPGPFTVFAPENEAFTRLAPGTMDTLLKPENKATLAKVLSYHVVPGKVTLSQLREQIKAGGGETTLTTVEGGPLTVAEEGAAIVLTDSSGNKSYIAQPDVQESNGVIHIVNGVVVPKLNVTEPAPAQ